MTETVHFRVKSPENFARLCITIMYEKRTLISDEDKIIFDAWYEIFNRGDDAACDKLVYDMLAKIMPCGGTIGQQQLEQLLNATIEYVKHECKEQIAKSSFARYDSAVYSKYNNETRYVTFAEHMNTIYEMCKEFFDDDLDEYSRTTIKNFIIQNFEVKGSQLSLEGIANDIAKYYGRFE